MLDKTTAILNDIILLTVSRHNELVHRLSLLGIGDPGIIECKIQEEEVMNLFKIHGASK